MTDRKKSKRTIGDSLFYPAVKKRKGLCSQNLSPRITICCRTGKARITISEYKQQGPNREIKDFRRSRHRVPLTPSLSEILSTSHVNSSSMARVAVQVRDSPCAGSTECANGRQCFRLPQTHFFFDQPPKIPGEASHTSRCNSVCPSPHISSFSSSSSNKTDTDHTS